MGLSAFQFNSRRRVKGAWWALAVFKTVASSVLRIEVSSILTLSANQTNMCNRIFGLDLLLKSEGKGCHLSLTSPVRSPMRSMDRSSTIRICWIARSSP